MPHLEFDPSRRRFLGNMLTGAGLLTAGVGVADMAFPLDDPQNRSFPPLTVTKEDFFEILRVRDACRVADIDPNSKACLKAEQDIGRELEAQVAYRGNPRQEQLDHDAQFLLIGLIIGLIGLRISRR